MSATSASSSIAASFDVPPPMEPEVSVPWRDVVVMGVPGGSALSVGQEEEAALEGSAPVIEMGGLPAKHRRPLRRRLSPSPRSGTANSRSRRPVSAGHGGVASFSADRAAPSRRSRATHSRLSLGVWSARQQDSGSTLSVASAINPRVLARRPGTPAAPASTASEGGLGKTLLDPALLHL